MSEATHLCPVILCSISWLSENIIPDLWEVGYLVSKDCQGNDNAV
jgi:hypothetical protein